MVKIDMKDRTIIQELLKDSKSTITKLAKKTGLPGTTVHNRIRKLEKNDIIVNYTVNLNYKKLGRPILAFIGVTVDYTAAKDIDQTKIAEQLKRIDGVYEAYIQTGGSDILAKVLAKDIDDLDDIVTKKMRKITGVDKTQTAIVLRQV